jgi:hypothetical protein
MVDFARQSATQVRWMAAFAALCLPFTGSTAAQPPVGGPPGAIPDSAGLNLLVLEGQNAVHDVGTPTTALLVIEVRDENHRPLEGVHVVFQLPLEGPSGSFEGGVPEKQGVTNVQGQASAAFMPNREVGRFAIYAKATLGARTGTISIIQRNEAVRNATWIARHKTLAVIIAVGAAGTAAAIATRSGSSSAAGSKPTVTITSGIPTFSPPQ